MISKTIRFARHVNAQGILEDMITHDWEPTDDRGQRGYLRDRTMLTVYTQGLHVKVTGTKKQLERWCRPVEEKLGSIPQDVYSDDYLDPELVSRTRGYIESVVRQINVCYTAKAYDGAAVLLRRLLETLIIELFEAKGIAANIKDGAGNFVYLSDLIKEALRVSDDPAGQWNLSRNSKAALATLKDCGDLSAHSRTYIAKKTDIDRLKASARTVTQELLAHAGIK
ncbi:MAG TPA: hypothetical protein VEX38_05450 [Fimbriimonadaceae bacterium]|nr:hypothetical protein [Fimbriimonadaceae bacterium]